MKFSTIIKLLFVLFLFGTLVAAVVIVSRAVESDPAVTPGTTLSIDDLDLIELNEAFAAQTLGCMRQLGLKHENTNVNGGAIALGHPTGCSGARIMVTLLHEMQRRANNVQAPFYGLATLCVGVGMGVSTMIEWWGEG